MGHCVQATPLNSGEPSVVGEEASAIYGVLEKFNRDYVNLGHVVETVKKRINGRTMELEGGEEAFLREWGKDNKLNIKRTDLSDLCIMDKTFQRLFNIAIPNF